MPYRADGKREVEAGALLQALPLLGRLRVYSPSAVSPTAFPFFLERR